MDKIIVTGGQKLQGKVRVEGAKNAVLPILAAALLASKGENVIKEVPNLADVFTINEVLKSLNAAVTYIPEDNAVYIDATKELSSEAQFEFVSKMRASILVMGSLLARNGYARVALPGGCAIGSRPIELHLKGFEAMGAKISFGHGYVEAKTEGRLKGANVYLDFPSVGATENIMTAASLAEGTTVIENAAKEPEIVDLANFINSMGGRVIGAGTNTIRIEGVDTLYGVEHHIIPDRIEAGTFMVAAAITRGDVVIENAVPEHMTALIAKMREMGVEITELDEGIRVRVPQTLKAVDIKTMPHPGFPTDMQSQMMALMLTAEGTSIITETVFENRFMHVEEFRRMNAGAKIEGRSVFIEGPVDLQGAEVMATDLRAAAALILAGLVSEGMTRVTKLHHLDRGYVDFHGKLASLGANIERITEEVVTIEDVTVELPTN
ncbi:MULTISPECIES: UDP-N-acetylglucosamine 1-carboxyvinyltransferase [Lysinibacillus]|uniref:UDP-N-acetylglucosamine 1-carboxyvinyltransferase n=1 Tax=Lysinibacillus boronitolerans JCM 21713 = 10a = NBRC 103108 TaxID=1294264 RepID=A0ABR4Y2T4_9BACI|nr:MULTISPECIES: UDP-N-acetylglucosamine 1-carboxyvinyltransferase [Lysinibacillus]MBX8942683.1 UDP-N-acetylglucosamine 1-carboxyvinyltransferase [Lysinibacillus sp. K60]MCM0624741.1 UDP-N-acetylglucosamine 1-carboxyvinyltransferase [Lysinibacillus sp. OL1_EC]KGR88017.1 UDP-N-acetylglucosamine 1-carboxyvinyltransferase [Lysinibacillus boronitolerans JCM 21713 = 10a = NBRC 103108]MCS1390566.1 UDP-N-acetylglucosamine 1-carboxyvinyltransferase [Lysinibacillus boronitolerans]MCS5502030.1 UDP-N-ace